MPEYQMAVGKSRFSTLKNLTKSIVESSMRYYMVNDDYPKLVSDLDIDLDVKNYVFQRYLTIYLNSGETCKIWTKAQQDTVACYKDIFGKSI